MHPDEIETSVELVRALLRDRHPRWADLPIEPVASAGTVHALYGLGADLLVRLPILPHAVRDVVRRAPRDPVLPRAELGRRTLAEVLADPETVA